ncbi:hypothetical protein Fmac_023588 [Flemingia macrophylla]|uniref:Uncharacterized protein n=1 Tax=Flemingia macrophylla TaxID=520843 RepID=A0ABD1LNI5_9FABA
MLVRSHPLNSTCNKKGSMSNTGSRLYASPRCSRFIARCFSDESFESQAKSPASKGFPLTSRTCRFERLPS